MESEYVYSSVRSQPSLSSTIVPASTSLHFKSFMYFPLAMSPFPLCVARCFLVPQTPPTPFCVPKPPLSPCPSTSPNIKLPPCPSPSLPRYSPHLKRPLRPSSCVHMPPFPLPVKATRLLNLPHLLRVTWRQGVDAGGPQDVSPGRLSRVKGRDGESKPHIKTDSPLHKYIKAGG